MRRYDWLKEIQRLDPERDFLRIHRITTTYEFPWDVARALELALYRTYAVPSIGRLLAETAELTDRTQKRYDDTALLLDTVIEHGFDSEDGRTAIRRINQMHRSYDITNDDMRYVLCTFVVTPKRWLDLYGWRRLSEHEKHATAIYRTLGRHMGITGIPQTYQEFERCLDDYEHAHFGWDEGGRRVSDATLGLMAGWYGPLAPMVRGAAWPCWTTPCWTPSGTSVPGPPSGPRCAARCGCAPSPSACSRRAAARTTPARTRKSRDIRTATSCPTSAPSPRGAPRAAAPCRTDAGC
ncbi:hypothetical protein SRIMM317S_01293 [Streptomyces rimosus subsp. rimosus]